MTFSVYRAIVFALLADRTFADAFPVEPDEGQQLIDRLDEFVASVHNRVVQSTGYDRLRVVVNASGEVLEFFKFMGYLLLNGTLGQCVHSGELQSATECVIRISNRSHFGDALVEFLAEDRDDNLEDIKTFPALILPEWQLASVDTNTYMSREYLKSIFAGTWTFFKLVQGRLAEALPAYVGMGWYDELPWKCHGFEVDVTGPIHDDTIKALTDLVGPSCDCLESSSASWSRKDSLQRKCEEFADEHGFNGGTSNRCLHKFIVRYNNYSAKAYENFVGRVAKYLYWDTIAHGLCLSISWSGKLVNATEANRRRTWIMQNIALIGDSLLEADSVLAETPPPYWIVEAQGVMENVIGNETVPYPSSADAVYFYKGIHDRFQTNVRSIPALRIKNLSDCQIDVLVYYPAYDSTEHCCRNSTDVILSGHFSGVNYVVSLRQEPVPSWITTNNETMERHFGDSQESDQCERIDEVDRKMANKLTMSEGLHAVAAVKCARLFVWYELGYQYFPAAYTEAPTVQIKQASTYSNNCGMLVLFP